MTSDVVIEAQALSKTFVARSVINNFTLSAHSGEVVGILGSNGSGKSTVLRMLAGLLRPDSGSVSLSVGGEEIPQRARPQHAGLVAPYMHVYEEFTPLELMSMHSSMLGSQPASTVDGDVLHRVGLYDRRNEHIKTFSSGLLQRAILALAVHHEPPLLLLDEPSVTMDDAGRRIVEQEILLQCQRGGIVCLATNDSREHALCTRTLSLS